MARPDDVLALLDAYMTGDPKKLPCGRRGKAAAAARGGGQAALDELRAEIGDCRRCGLCAKRTQVVFGYGSPQAGVVFIGEAPGEEEDRQGIPFVGRSGQLLTQFIAGIGLTREEVYIANICKCRPPDNRKPQSGEVTACEPFLKRQLAIIKPRVICALGNVAMQTLLRTKTGISKLRGQTMEYAGIPLIPTYHPAFILRQGGTKCTDAGNMMRDFERLKKIIDKCA